MESNIGCHVIRDILPLYMDGLTSDESNELIKEHIDKCNECKKLEEAMRIGENNSTIDSVAEEIDGFRKIKMFNKKKIGKVIAISICVTILIACSIVFNTYIKGEKMDSSNLEITLVSVEDKDISLEIKSKDNVSGITNVEVKDNDGDIKVIVKGAPRSIFSKNVVAIDKKYDTSIKKVTVADAVMVEDGYIIDEATRNIYNRRLESAKNEKKLKELIEYIHVKVPYFNADLVEVDASNPQKIILEASKYGNMEAKNVENYAALFSYYMFVCVDELEIIEWKYKIKDKDEDKDNMYRIQLSDAEYMLSVEDLKSFGETAAGIIKLEDVINNVENIN